MFLGHRLPAAAVLDWDGTLRRGFLLQEWVQFLASGGYLKLSTLEGINSLFERYRSGHLEYSALAKQVPPAYAKGLRGLLVGEIERLAKKFVESDNNVGSDAKKVMSLLKELRFHTVVISGSPKVLLMQYKKLFMLGEVYGLEIGVTGQRWNGRVLLNPGIASSKAEIVSSISNRYTIVIAIGDSVTDAPILNAAEFPIYVSDAKRLPRGITRHSCLTAHADLFNRVAQIARNHQAEP